MLRCEIIKRAADVAKRRPAAIRKPCQPNRTITPASFSTIQGWERKLQPRTLPSTKIRIMPNASEASAAGRMMKDSSLASMVLKVASISDPGVARVW